MLTKTDLAKGSSRTVMTPSGKMPAPSSKLEADENDSEGDDELRELMSASGREVAPTAASANDDGSAAATVVAGGAFNNKSKYFIDDFTVIRVLGKGAFGKVMLVRLKNDGVIYAMKSLNKQQLLEKNEVAHTKTERKALEDTHHPYLVHLRFAFQSSTKLYLVMDCKCNPRPNPAAAPGREFLLPALTAHGATCMLLVQIVTAASSSTI